MVGRDRRVGRLRAREAVSRFTIREDEHDPRVGQRGRILRIDQRLKIRPCGGGGGGGGAGITIPIGE